MFFVFSVQLVAKKVQCDADEQRMGYQKNVDACAKKCRGISEMFVYGTNKHGMKKCRKDGACKCFCEKATTNYQCNKRVTHNGYYLYKFLKGKLYSIF